MGNKANLDQLNSFLRGELSAVETYRMALDKLDAGSPARADLEACMMSHQQRVDFLREAVMALGGEPSDGSGPWGVFAKAVEGTARAFGDKLAINALEEGEDHGLKDYKKGLDDKDLDMQTRSMISGQLLPAQQATHNRMSALKKTLH